MDFNNMKYIREVYGATQEEISKVAGVNRSTVSLWETGASKASNTKLEKLSLFYGIGPEAFYKIEELGDERRTMLQQSAAKARAIQEESKMQRNKADEFANMLGNADFKTVRSKFVVAMKMLLATTDQAETIEDLEMTSLIVEKMLERLKSATEIRKKEETMDQPTLLELLKELE